MHNCLLLSFLLIVLSCNNLFSQNLLLDWAISNQGSEEIAISDISFDDDGNIYTAGHFRGTVDLDPGMETSYVVSNGFRDVFIQKLDPNGNLIWFRTFGGTGFDNAAAIKLDEFGGIFVTGRFENEVDFDGGLGVFLKNSNGETDFFVEKLDSDGNFIWVKSFGGINDDWSHEIKIDNSGNLYVSGSFSHEVDFDESDAIELAVSSGNKDVFVLKLTNDGDLIWVRTAGGPGREFGIGITIMEEANMVCVTGEFRDSVDFDPSVEDEALLYSNGFTDAFIWSLSTSGNYKWAKNIGGTSYDAGNDIEESNGNLVISGYFNDSVDFNPDIEVDLKVSAGYRDIFILKLDSLGNYISSTGIGGTGHDDPVAITIDDSSNIYTSGYFQWTVDFDPSADAEAFLTTVDEFDGFLLKINHDLEFEWAYGMKGTEDESCNLLEIDPSGAIYTGGWFRGMIDFDPSETVYNIESLGNADGYIVKYEECLVAKSNLIDNTLFASPNDAEYQWLDCELDFEEIEGETSQTYTPSESGTYAVEVNLFGCIDTSRCIEYVLDDLFTGKILNSSPISIYPNPFSDFTTINFENEYGGVYELILHNALGQEVYRNENITETQLIISKEELGIGIYLLSLTTNIGTYTAKLIVQ